MTRYKKLQDRAANDPGIPKIGQHTTPNGDTAGLVVCIGYPMPGGEIITPWTAITYTQATELRDLITELLDDVPDPTAGLDLGG